MELNGLLKLEVQFGLPSSLLVFSNENCSWRTFPTAFLGILKEFVSSPMIFTIFTITQWFANNEHSWPKLFAELLLCDLPKMPSFYLVIRRSFSRISNSPNRLTRMWTCAILLDADRQLSSWSVCQIGTVNCSLNYADQQWPSLFIIASGIRRMSWTWSGCPFGRCTSVLHGLARSCTVLHGLARFAPSTILDS